MPRAAPRSMKMASPLGHWGTSGVVNAGTNPPRRCCDRCRCGDAQAFTPSDGGDFKGVCRC